MLKKQFPKYLQGYINEILNKILSYKIYPWNVLAMDDFSS